MKRYYILIFYVFLISACGEKVNSIFGTESQFDLDSSNSRTISRLVNQVSNTSAEINIGIIADSHHNYDDLAEVIKKLNKRNFDFVVHLGDFSDLGLVAEYDAFADIMSELRHPYIAVIGNHDAIGSGKKLYRKMFGRFNFDFVYNGKRFIFFNSNTLEFRGDRNYNPEWLFNRLIASAEDMYLFQHVNFSEEIYFPKTEQVLIESKLATSPNLKMVVNGHKHAFVNKEFGAITLRYICEVKGVRYATLKITPNGDELYWCTHDSCELSNVIR